MTFRERLTQRVQAVLDAEVARVAPGAQLAPVVLLTPKQAAHGDYTCPAALALARHAGRPPRQLAQALADALGDADGLLARAEVAGPGHLNLFVADAAWHAELATIVARGGDYLRAPRRAAPRILLEFVSANPTGPLHVAHARGAVVGDVLANLLDAAGYPVEREYYVNDAGNQMTVLGQSVRVRYAALCGVTVPVPETFYPADYVGDIAAAVYAEHGAAWMALPEDALVAELSAFGGAAMLARIRADLAGLGVRFDRFVSEAELTARVDVMAMLRRLEAEGHVYTQDGRRWFRSTAFGDDKDRVVVRDDGRTTYFAADIAYHDDKMRRGYDHLINVWGADHDGYLARVRAGLQALGHPQDVLDVIFIQMVSLSRGGTQVKMGKRLGTAVWLADIVAEAGRDATRYMFSMRRADAQMEFDIDLATQQTLDNPVFYAQMGHARLAAIARRAQAEQAPAPSTAPEVLAALTLPDELALIRGLAAAPDVVADAARAREPHQLVHYLQGLIAQFHSYYSRYRATHRVISDDPRATAARLALCAGLAAVLKKLLEILGVAAPEIMTLEEGTD